MTSTTFGHNRPTCPDCDYPLRYEEGTAIGRNEGFLVCHMCSKGWSSSKILDWMIKNPPNTTGVKSN